MATPMRGASKGSPDANISDGSASVSEKHATSVGATVTRAPASASASVSAPNPRLRSCLICRRRKVRCDKASPCSNCRRANIACVVPSDDRPPRWARRLDRLTHAAHVSDAAAEATAARSPPQQGPERTADPQATVVMERLRNLEGLVRELSGQLEQANAAASSADGGYASRVPSVGNSPGVGSAAGSHDRDADRGTRPSPAARGTGVQGQSGRMVLKDANRSRYVSSGFWTRVDDELHGLKMDLESGMPDSSEDEDHLGDTPSTHELDRTPSERHAFLFQHNLVASSSNSRQFHPLPSQIPFLLNTYAENVNIFIQIVHMPTVTKMTRELRGGNLTSLPPANEALLFAIYYAAVTSMEEDDVLNNFGTSKRDLNLKFRLGLEYALAKADFLNVPDIVVVQAFIIFLSLVRRHDSPRFVWMMVGLVIRMAQSLGLHRDGSEFSHLTPYEVEIRRRAWWSICMLDVRASEDQGTEYTIPMGSFDTKIPLNINDADIGPDIKETPAERQSLTDMSFAVDAFKICDLTRQMMSPGNKTGAPGLEEQVRLVTELYTTFEQGYLQYTSKEDDSIARWVGITCVRLTMSKMTLMIYLPILSSSSSSSSSSASDNFSDEVRDKLLVAAIEVAEYNHALNAEQACRQWRWMYQTYTHWHAIVLLLIEIARRPASPLVERAWVALHSRWLIPPAQQQTDGGRKLQIWIPLRRLMAKARGHRDAELRRLRGDAQAAERAEWADRHVPAPASPGLFPSDESFREHWRGLVGFTERSAEEALSAHQPGWSDAPRPSITVSGAEAAQQQQLDTLHPYEQHGFLPTTGADPVYVSSGGSSVVGQQIQGPSSVDGNMDRNPVEAMGSMPWMWADTDPATDVFGDEDVNMDVDNEADWLSWLESAKNMELNQGGIPYTGTGWTSSQH